MYMYLETVFRFFRFYKLVENFQLNDFFAYEKYRKNAAIETITNLN